MAMMKQCTNLDRTALPCPSNMLDKHIHNLPMFSALKDQIAAGAFMWVIGSLVFLVPAIYLATQFLANDRLVNEKTGLEKARALAQ